MIHSTVDPGISMYKVYTDNTDSAKKSTRVVEERSSSDFDREEVQDFAESVGRSKSAFFRRDDVSYENEPQSTQKNIPTMENNHRIPMNGAYNGSIRQPSLPPYINNKYELLDHIGNGKFGKVFHGKNRYTHENVAIKIDTSHSTGSPNPTHTSVLKHETRMLNYVYTKRCVNIPLIYWYGLYNGCPALVMPYYEMSIYDWFMKQPYETTKYNPSQHITKPNSSEHHVKLLDVQYIMKSILNILASIHDSGVVHRDIKPHNFMLKNGQVFLIDFGMATFYVDEEYRHITESDIPKQHLLGTRKYVSIHVHLGKEYTRRDDIISSGYLYMFLRHMLYWDNPKYETPEFTFADKPCSENSETHIHHPRNIRLLYMKELSAIETYLRSQTTHDTTALLNYLQYSYCVGFNETPNYTLLSNLLDQSDFQERQSLV